MGSRKHTTSKKSAQKTQNTRPIRFCRFGINVTTIGMTSLSFVLDLKILVLKEITMFFDHFVFSYSLLSSRFQFVFHLFHICKMDDHRSLT